MKTIKLFLLTLFCCISNIAINQAQGLSPEASRFKSNLMSFIREEGYVPTESNDGKTISFKKEGESYSIFLSGTVPVQITMRIEGFTNKGANVLAILLACNEVNRDTYYVKAFVDELGDEGTTNIVIEMPCHTAEEFRYVFNDCVKALSSAQASVKESYNKNETELDDSNKPFEITACSVGIENRNGKTITPFGQTLYSYKTKYLKPQLTIKSEQSGNFTIYYKLYTPDGRISTGTTSPSGYSTSTNLYIYSGTRAYNLSGWGSDTAGHWRTGEYKYEFYCNGVNLGYYTFTIY